MSARTFSAAPSKGLYDWNNQNGPAKDVQVRLSSIDVVGTCANVRIDEDNWTGHAKQTF